MHIQSRYYDPSICRFINADLPEYAKVQKNEQAGINLFVYCCNDPVNNCDPSGFVTSYKISNLLKIFITNYLLKGKTIVSSSKIKSDGSGMCYINVKYKKSKYNTNKLRITFGNQTSWNLGINTAYNNSSKNVDFYANLTFDSFADCSNASWKNCERGIIVAFISIGVIVGNLIYCGTKLSTMQKYYDKVWGRNGIDPRDRQSYCLFMVTKDKTYNGYYILKTNNKGYQKL